MTYDPAGNELTTKDPNGVTTTYTYTPAGQKASVTSSDSSTHSVTYKYDADGFRTGMTDASGSSSYTPDPFGELATAQNGNNQIVSYAYDLDGNIAAITYPLPATATWATTKTVTYGYDNSDRLASVTDLTGGKITITPNADGQQESETLASSPTRPAAAPASTRGTSTSAARPGITTTTSWSRPSTAGRPGAGGTSAPVPLPATPRHPGHSGLDLLMEDVCSACARTRRYGPAGPGTVVTSPRGVAVQLRMS